MSKPLLELITCESGDWSVLRIDLSEGFEYAGHDIPDFIWINFIKKLGFNVEYKRISDEDMEEGNY
jgi:hypothetical protein